MKKYGVAIDFDGVIHSYESGWKGVDVIPDAPVPNAIETIANYVYHYTVHVYSVRSRSFRGRRAMKEYIYHHLKKKYGELVADNIFKEIKFPWFKPKALMYIDDRAFRFEGKFPTIKTIKETRP